MRCRSWLIIIGVCGAACASTAQGQGAIDPTPATLDEFKAAAARVLDETGVPGAGLALVGVNGTEWAGGIGWADRDARVPVTADTHFRAGSISKSFVALALVQLYEDGTLDLDAPVKTLLPGLPIDNPWDNEAPVLVRHLLEHTAGFDDMHFNETYVLEDAPDLPLEEVLFRSPDSRRVRWRPGTRMSYSNPGYGVAGFVLEQVAGKPFEQVIEERIFRPLDMTTSGFGVAPESDAALAQGYDARTGPPVERRRIYLRPAGALHTSAGELAHFVQMLLAWGERGGGYVVDPEYQSNMEWPQTTLASTAGVRAGYGLGISSTLSFPYHVLGHNGGIDGFLSSYGYSPSRDVGYVVLVNSTHAPEAVRRLASLAIRYLKRDVQPAPKPALEVSQDALRRFEGHYRGASPRNSILQFVEYLRDGTTVRLDGPRLTIQRDFGEAEPLVPVNDALFRRERDLDATLAFAEAADGSAVLTGPGTYAVRQSRWRIDLLRAGLLFAAICVVVGPVAAVARRLLGSTPPGFPGIGVVWGLAAGALALMWWLAVSSGVTDLAVAGPRSMALLAATAGYPLLAALSAALAAWGWSFGSRGAFAGVALVTSAAHLGIAAYLGWWGLLAFRSWTY